MNSKINIHDLYHSEIGFVEEVKRLTDDQLERGITWADRNEYKIVEGKSCWSQHRHMSRQVREVMTSELDSRIDWDI